MMFVQKLLFLNFAISSTVALAEQALWILTYSNTPPTLGGPLVMIRLVLKHQRKGLTQLLILSSGIALSCRIQKI